MAAAILQKVIEAIAVELVKRGISKAAEEAKKMFSSDNKYVFKQTKSGGEWYSIVDAEKKLLISAYYHPDLRHTATTIGAAGK